MVAQAVSQTAPRGGPFRAFFFVRAGRCWRKDFFMRACKVSFFFERSRSGVPGRVHCGPASGGTPERYPQKRTRKGAQCTPLYPAGPHRVRAVFGWFSGAPHGVLSEDFSIVVVGPQLARQIRNDIGHQPQCKSPSLMTRCANSSLDVVRVLARLCGPLRGFECAWLSAGSPRQLCEGMSFSPRR